MNIYRDNERNLLQEALQHSSLSEHVAECLQLYDRGWEKILRHGDLPRWQEGFQALPKEQPSSVDLNQSAIRMGHASDTSMPASDITNALQAMHPWRKGPFNIFDVFIDTEWHSDWKWERLQQHISPLQDRTILDVGCGSGYHIWRMMGEGSQFAVGIDPTPLFSMHFATVKRYLPDTKAFLLPVGIDDMPQHMQCFDTVFSMGIL